MARGVQSVNWQDERSKRSWSEHPPYEQEQNTLQWPLPCQRFKKKATSIEAAVESKHPLFQLERDTKHNGRIFTRYPVNASENGDFNRGRKNFLANTMLKF